MCGGETSLLRACDTFTFTHTQMHKFVLGPGKSRVHGKLVSVPSTSGQGSGGGSQVVLVVKNPPTNARDARDTGSMLGLGRSPGGGHGKRTPVLLSGGSHEQKSLAGYSPWGHKELDRTEVTEQACTHF